MASAFLYFCAAAPFVFKSDDLIKKLGGASAVFICMGGLLFKTKYMSNIINSASRSLAVGRERVLHVLSWIAFLITALICIGYVIKYHESNASSFVNVILSPFGLLFFYIGRWCVFRPGARYGKD
jgi:hypothetical protein